MFLANRLKELRSSKGESLQALATAISISKPYVWELEKGTANNPTIDIVQKLANHFGVSVSYFTEKSSITEKINQELLDFMVELEKINLSHSDIEVLRSTAKALGKSKTN